MKSVCVIGLGYVGLPLALLSLEKGYTVYGLENSPVKVEKLAKEHPNISLNSPDALLSDVIIIAVPTPVDEKKLPDLTPVRVACEQVAEKLTGKGQLIILESTVNPFVSRKYVLPILEKKGFKEGKDFFLVHCPERIDPGNRTWNVSNIPRVIGALSPQGLELSTEFYKSILSAGILPLSSIEAAEMTKIYENSLRAVNIAFANEMAIVMQNMKLDAKEIIQGVKTKPFGLDLCFPSCGVGGHCIPVDPFYLIDESLKRGFDPSFLRTAMRVNGYMPAYTVSLLMHALNETGKSVNGARVGVLGVSYKRNVDDVRESPALDIIKRVKSLGAELKVYDPFIPDYTNATAEEVLACDAVLLLTDHSEFLDYDYSKVPVVIDGKNALDKKSMSGVYKGIGR
ncbi:nucleotide sugar dehydrogenase [Candidatus Woesearchaeota archaeon]|nr:nucleotide sugar dehydrogenase [Candidatus Woesearchaeota archaeon]